MSTAGARIEVSDVTKEFVTRSRERVTALSKLSITVDAGSFVSILGPSGCGKSTLLRIIAGLVPPSTGVATIGNQKVTGPRRDIGMVFQTPVLLPWRTVLANVLLPAEVIGMERAEAGAKARELLDLVGLGQFVNKLPSELSGGMRQRVAIARALMHDPATLLMDEPFGALDAMTRETMNLELLRIWQARRKTVVLVTHSIDEAIFLADRVVIMSRRPGRVLGNVSVPLPRPRSTATRHDPGFVALASQLREMFEAMPMDEGGAS